MATSSTDMSSVICIFPINPTVPKRALYFPRGYLTVSRKLRHIGTQTMSLFQAWITFGRFALRELADTRFCRKYEGNVKAEGRLLYEHINTFLNVDSLSNHTPSIISYIVRYHCVILYKMKSGIINYSVC